jgi:hypothetical protein
MASLTTTRVSVATGTLDLDANLTAAASGGDSAEVGTGKFLVIKNGDASAKTVTIVTPGTKSGLAIADGTYVVAAGDYCFVPLANVFRGSDGRAAITYSAVTSVSVGAFELGD